MFDLLRISACCGLVRHMSVFVRYVWCALCALYCILSIVLVKCLMKWVPIVIIHGTLSGTLLLYV